MVVNIVDYCIKYKNSSFKQVPFNYVDGLLLAEFAYCDFDHLFVNKHEYTIGQLATLFFESDDIDSRIITKSFIYDSPDILLSMSKSNRFKDCKVYNYVSNLNPDDVLQFSAVMIDLPDKTTAVCFRGTDDTLIGWHEDLKLSYELMPSQLKAKQYVDSNCKIFKKYRFLGHSKGGNLALYAAVNCKFLLNSFIKQVISYDGPGLKNDTYRPSNLKRIMNKYIKIMPEYDLFGCIFDNGENKMVVKSNINGVLAHNGFSWLIEDTNFIEVNDINDTSKRLKEGLNRFINQTSSIEKQIMIDEVFNSLNKAGISSVSGFIKGGIPIAIETLISLSKMQHSAKDTAIKLLKIIYDVYEPSTIKKAKSVNNEVSQFVSDRIKDIEKLFR